MFQQACDASWCGASHRKQYVCVWLNSLRILKLLRAPRNQRIYQYYEPRDIYVWLWHVGHNIWVRFLVHEPLKKQSKRFGLPNKPLHYVDKTPFVFVFPTKLSGYPLFFSREQFSLNVNSFDINCVGPVYQQVLSNRESGKTSNRVSPFIFPSQHGFRPFLCHGIAGTAVFVCQREKHKQRLMRFE